MSTEMSCHFIHLLQVSKKGLQSLMLYNFIQELIHVYSPGAGADSPLGDKILMSTDGLYHFTHLLQVSMKFLWSLIYSFFFMIFYMYIAVGQGAYSPKGTKF